jgi:hypothetical protein
MRLMSYELGMSSGTVGRGIRALEMHNIIKVDRQHKEYNVYELLKPYRWKKIGGYRVEGRKTSKEGKRAFMELNKGALR